MLYRTVYGPELSAIYGMIIQRGDSGASRDEIERNFIPNVSPLESISSQSLDDALAFLSAAHLIYQVSGLWKATDPAIDSTDFQLQTMFLLRQLQMGKLQCRHKADPTFMLLLEDLYAMPNKHIVHDLFVQSNRLEAVQAVGGLNREKLQGWRRVMCYLGLGIQLHGSFLFAPDTQLLMRLVKLAGIREGSLQDLVERHMCRFLPCIDSSGDLTSAVAHSFRHLHQVGYLALFTQQDTPSRPYMRERYRGFRVLNHEHS